MKITTAREKDERLEGLFLKQRLRTLLEVAMAIGKREGLLGKDIPAPFSGKQGASDDSFTNDNFK